MASTDDEAIIMAGYRFDDDHNFSATKLSGDGKIIWDWEVSTI